MFALNAQLSQDMVNALNVWMEQDYVVLVYQLIIYSNIFRIL